MSLEGQRKEGAKPQAPGASDRELPSPYHLAKDSLMRLAPGVLGATAPTPHFCSTPVCATLQHG